MHFPFRTHMVQTHRHEHGDIIVCANLTASPGFHPGFCAQMKGECGIEQTGSADERIQPIMLKS